MKDRNWRKAVGGMWSHIGQLQFQFMLMRGLRPNHNFLDVGCGCLRGGIHFINFLDSGRYYGIDKDAALIQAGIKHEIPLAGLERKEITLHVSKHFDFDFFNTSFDFAIAQSLFTHLDRELILQCLRSVKLILNPKGQFYATFFEAKNRDEVSYSIRHHPGDIISYPDKDPYHYHLSFFEEVARELGFTLTYLGNWNHPRDQMMILFQLQH